MSSGSPQMRLTFTLKDGSQVSKVCGYIEALAQLAEAKRWPEKWSSFKIEGAEDRCENCKDIGTDMTVAGRTPGSTMRVCAACIDDYRQMPGAYTR